MKTRKRKTMFIFLIVFVIFNLASSVFALELDKTQYQLGDVVKITIDSGFVDEGYSLEIASKESVYRYLELIELDIIFIPRYIGEYDLRIVDRLNDQVIVSRSFEVIDPSIKEPGLTDMGEKETKKIIDEINSKVEQTVTISIRDGKNNIRQKSAILRKKDSIPKNNIQSDFNIFRVNSLSQETNKASTPDSNSVEFIPGTNGPVKKIIFNDLDVENNLELGLDEIDDSIKKKEDKDFKKLYAIDPSKLDFSEANVTSVAEGKELYKCKDWNFSEQKCYGSWVKIMDLVPGQEYTFTLTPADPGFGESSPPEPHNVQGRVFNSDGVTGVDNGVPVLLNNTDNECTTHTFFKGSLFCLNKWF